MISWVEDECTYLHQKGDLALNLPPNFFPFIKPSDPDWFPRYEFYNKPGEYHNGGIWPFVCGFYIAALVAAKRFKLAQEKLIELTHCVKVTYDGSDKYGFNEWIKAQDGNPMGQEWQTWSAALYLYAAKCVETSTTPFFDQIRTVSSES
jgi:glycogen debranching enzyme